MRNILNPDAPRLIRRNPALMSDESVMVHCGDQILGVFVHFRSFVCLQLDPIKRQASGDCQGSLTWLAYLQSASSYRLDRRHGFYLGSETRENKLLQSANGLVDLSGAVIWQDWATVDRPCTERIPEFRLEHFSWLMLTFRLGPQILTSITTQRLQSLGLLLDSSHQSKARHSLKSVCTPALHLTITLFQISQLFVTLATIPISRELHAARRVKSFTDFSRFRYSHLKEQLTSASLSLSQTSQICCFRIYRWIFQALFPIATAPRLEPKSIPNQVQGSHLAVIEPQTISDY